jgi:hypothetical protein
MLRSDRRDDLKSDKLFLFCYTKFLIKSSGTNSAVMDVIETLIVG